MHQNARFASIALCLGFILITGCDLFEGFDQPGGEGSAPSDLAELRDSSENEDGSVDMPDLSTPDFVGTDGAQDDLATPDLAGSDGPDVMSDFAGIDGPMVVIDLVMPDLEPVVDAGSPDFSKMLDLIKDDGPLVVVDLAMPDFKSVVDMAFVDLVQPLDLVQPPDLVRIPGQLAFTSKSVSANFGTVAFAVGDFTIDGKLDVVVAGKDSAIRIYKGIGDGSFTVNPNGYGASPGLRSCIVVNLDGDNKPDLITTGLDNNGWFNSMLNDAVPGGQGSFKVSNSWGYGGDLPTHPVTADWNRDGKQDAAVMVNGGIVSVLRGDGGGGFTNNFLKMTFMNPTNISALDWNGDGVSDIIALTSKGIELVKGWGDGTFHVPVVTPLPGGITVQGLKGVDFNRDTRNDLAVSYTSQAGAGVLVFLGDGKDRFTLSTQIVANASNTPGGLVVGDFNKDKFMDLAVGNSGGQKFTVFLGDGFGKMGSGNVFSAGADPMDLATGDWNSDGKLDIAILSTTLITVMLNTTL